MSYEDDKKAIDEKLAKFEALTESLTAMTAKVEGQEELTQKYKQEMGDIRKDLGILKESKGSGGTVDDEKLQKLIDKVDELDNNIKISSKNASKGGTGDEGDWDEKKLSKEAREKADALYKTLAPEQKAYIAASPEKRTEFLKAAQEATSTVPESLFEEPAEGEPTINEFRKLFGTVGNDASHIPGITIAGAGNGGYAGAESGLEGGVHLTKRLPSGSIPRGRKLEDK